jgi:hypothetical protein
VEQVARVAVRERRGLIRHRGHGLPNPEDDHLAQRRAERGQAGGVAEEGVDRGVAEPGHVLAARVAAPAG